MALIQLKILLQLIVLNDFFQHVYCVTQMDNDILKYSIRYTFNDKN